MSELIAHLDLPLGVDAPAVARRVVTAVLGGWGFRDPVPAEKYVPAGQPGVLDLRTGS